MMENTITDRLDVDSRELWFHISLKHVEEEDNRLGGNFLHTRWNDVVAKLCPDITFWKRDMVKGIKIKTS
jgi:hypothetical protein